MIEIEKPKIECLEIGENNQYGKFVIEPLERGFGTTLGNSLRRVLLSSLPGIAVTSIRIGGVLHEFTTVPGVKEDVAEIILNLKELSIKLHSDEPKTVTIHASGPGEVTAGDIQGDETVEVVVRDHHIATLNEDADFSMEMTLEKGRGYVTAERNKQSNMPIGIIPVDSIFTPIRKVNYVVEDTRVGQVTDYDKLTLEVWTNGAIAPDEAVSLSAKLLTEHLLMFIHLTDHVVSVDFNEPGEDDKEKLLDITIEEMDLKVRAFNCLKRAGINTVGDLLQRTHEELGKVRNMGKVSVKEVEEKLHDMGLSLRPDEE